jgi:hypothetical protein
MLVCAKCELYLEPAESAAVRLCECHCLGKGCIVRYTMTRGIISLARKAYFSPTAPPWLFPAQASPGTPLQPVISSTRPLSFLDLFLFALGRLVRIA